MRRSLIALLVLAVGAGSACAELEGSSTVEGPGGIDAEAAGGDFCSVAVAIEGQFDTSEMTPETAREFAASLTPLVAVAPEELRDDIRTVIDQYGDLVDAVSAATTDDERLGAFAQYAHVMTASTNVVNAVNERCGDT